jgi:hypothetical protein
MQRAAQAFDMTSVKDVVEIQDCGIQISMDTSKFAQTRKLEIGTSV